MHRVADGRGRVRPVRRETRHVGAGQPLKDGPLQRNMTPHLRNSAGLFNATIYTGSDRFQK